MASHDHNIALDRYSTMGYQYYDGDQYYDAVSNPIQYECSLYQPHSGSYYIPNNMMLAVPDPQGEQQLIPTPIHEYPQGDHFTSTSFHYPSPDLSSTASADFHDAGACSSISTYSSFSRRRPSYPPSWAQDVQNNITHVAAAQSSEYRATIARFSNDFLANASSLFGGSTSRTRNASSTLNGPSLRSSTTRTGDFTPTRKRSLEAMNEEAFVDKQIGAHANAPPTTDQSCLPQPHMTVPSQNNVLHEHRGSMHASESQDPLRSPPHPVRHSLSPDSSLLRDEVRSAAHQPNKRPHRSEEIVRHSHSHTTSGPATWSVPGESVMKVSAARKTGEQKKQALACLFCRERKIACGRPSAHSPDQTCNQCARRRMKCEYPTESRRGQHKRIRRKPIEERSETASASSALQSTPNTPPLQIASTT